MDRASDSPRRVVITGLGVVSPIGCDTQQFWDSLVTGRSGVVEFPEGGADLPACAGRIDAFTGDIGDFGPLEGPLKKSIRKSLKVMSRQTRMGVAAVQQALNDSHLLDNRPDPQRVGVCFGADNVSMLPEDFLPAVQACTDENGFNPDRWGTDGLPEVPPLWMLTCLPNMPACHVAILNDLRGPNNSITQREVSANLAVAEAYRVIQDSDADAMIVGATGTGLEPINMLHGLMNRDVSKDDGCPQSVCRPFDRQRTGAVLAEGAAALVLENWQTAAARGATMYGEIVGVGSSCAVDRYGNTRLDTAISNALRSALKQADMPADRVGHVHAHGLSTRASDVAEARAIRQVFQDENGDVPVVAAKSNMGNAHAGSGAIEMVASLLAMKRGRLFRVLNYEEPDPQCAIAAVIDAETDAGDSFVNLSAAAHGRASCVSVRACA